MQLYQIRFEKYLDELVESEQSTSHTVRLYCEVKITNILRFISYTSLILYNFH